MLKHLTPLILVATRVAVNTKSRDINKGKVSLLGPLGTPSAVYTPPVALAAFSDRWLLGLSVGYVFGFASAQAEFIAVRC